MLRLNLTGLSDSEVKAVVTERCAQCGAVKRVDFYRGVDPPNEVMAIVDMSSEDELARVLVHLHGCRFGDSALIRLEHASTD